MECWSRGDWNEELSNVTVTVGVCVSILSSGLGKPYHGEGNRIKVEIRKKQDIYTYCTDADASLSWLPCFLLSERESVALSGTQR